MTGAQGEGRGPNRGSSTGKRPPSDEGLDLSEIEYLLFQSTQGIHFAFDNREIAKILRIPSADADFFTQENMAKVQALLTSFLNHATLTEKRNYLAHLPRADYELMVRAYFQLVDNAILAHSTLRH